MLCLPVVNFVARDVLVPLLVVVLFVFVLLQGELEILEPVGESVGFFSANLSEKLFLFSKWTHHTISQKKTVAGIDSERCS